MPFFGKFATNFWRNTTVYYNAPSRWWAFDAEFLNQGTLFPGTPLVRKLVRGRSRVIDSSGNRPPPELGP